MDEPRVAVAAAADRAGLARARVATVPCSEAHWYSSSTTRIARGLERTKSRPAMSSTAA